MDFSRSIEHGGAADSSSKKQRWREWLWLWWPAAVILAFVVGQAAYITVAATMCLEPQENMLDINASDLVDYLMSANTQLDGDAATQPLGAHQTWKTREMLGLHFNSAPEWNKTFSAYTLHTDRELLDMFNEQYPALLRLYTGYANNVQRADVARVALMHQYGGLYADVDAFPMNLSSRLGALPQAVIDRAYIPIGAGGVASNHYLLADKGNPFLRYVLDSYPKLHRRWRWFVFPYLRVFFTTGPCGLHLTMQSWARMWAERGVRPAPHVARIAQPHSFIEHRQGRTWHELDGMVFNWFADNWYPYHAYFMVVILTLCSLGAFALARFIFLRAPRIKRQSKSG